MIAGVISLHRWRSVDNNKMADNLAATLSLVAACFFVFLVRARLFSGSAIAV
jgi:hypothetical protein